MSPYKCSFRIYIIFYHRRPFNKTAATLVRPHLFSTLCTTPLGKMTLWMFNCSILPWHSGVTAGTIGPSRPWESGPGTRPTTSTWARTSTTTTAPPWPPASAWTRPPDMPGGGHTLSLSLLLLLCPGCTQQPLPVPASTTTSSRRPARPCWCSYLMETSPRWGPAAYCLHFTPNLA